MGKIELYIMRIILILFTLISTLYSNCTVNITKDFFNTNIVAYYLNAIDVNSGKNLKVVSKELNLLACGEICRLIKVLGIGGKIIIDFLND